MDLIVPSPAGLFCPIGDFHIDPWRPTPRAIITHGHADHARWGSDAYLCHTHCAPVLRKRLGDVCVETVEYGASFSRNGVTVSLHPAGHVLGSAQVRIEYKGEIWVVSGDYKLEHDATCAAFEPVRCDAFITESTFALPIYRWRPQADVLAEINRWWAENAAAGRASVLFAYGLGKAQRIIYHLDDSIGPILCHNAIEPINNIYRACGAALPITHSATAKHDKATLSRAIILAPPSAAATPWLRRFGDYSDAFASGWMQIRGNRRRRGVDRGFPLSDHADWPGLLEAISATRAQRIFVTHGASAALVRYLRETDLSAFEWRTEYGADDLQSADEQPTTSAEINEAGAL